MWFIKGFFANIAKILVGLMKFVMFICGAATLGFAVYGYITGNMPIGIWSTAAFAVSIAIFTLLQKAKEVLQDV